MDQEQLLRLVVPRSQVVIAELPGGREALLHRQAVELSFPHPLQHTAPDLGVASRGIDRLRLEGIPVRSKPALRRLVALLPQERDTGYVLLRLGQGISPLEHQHAFSRGNELGRQAGACGPGADHDHVMLLIINDQARSGAGDGRIVHGHCQT